MFLYFYSLLFFLLFLFVGDIIASPSSALSNIESKLFERIGSNSSSESSSFTNVGITFFFIFFLVVSGLSSDIPLVNLEKFKFITGCFSLYLASKKFNTPIPTLLFPPESRIL